MIIWLKNILNNIINEINLIVFEHELYSLMDLKFALKENTIFVIQARFKIWNNLDFQNIQSNHKTLFKIEFITHEISVTINSTK